jgi:Ca2+-binding EF-hand superfamily protein
VFEPQQYGILLLLKSLEITLPTCFFWILQQINQMIADVDKDGSGAIDYEEFEHMMTAKIGERDSKEELTKAFRIIDQDRNVK